MTSASIKLRNYAILWLVIIILTIAIRGLSLGGDRVVTLGSADTLSGAISQSFVAGGSTAAIPTAGKDYQIDSTKYLDNKNWALAWVMMGGQASNRAVVVLHKIDGAYQVVLGPGTAFSISSSSGLPSDVLSYLHAKGIVIYTPVGGQ